MFEGELVAIYVAPTEGAPMEARAEVRAIAGKGLEGDRYAVEAGTYSGRRIEDSQRAVTLIEREAVTLPLDHAFGFELADVGPAAIEVLR